MKVQVITYGKRQIEDSTHIGDSLSLTDLKSAIGQFSEETILVINSDQCTLDRGDLDVVLSRFEAQESEVLFSASAAFKHDNEGLRYYFWKFYPRGENPYHYLDSNAIIARSQSLSSLISEIEEAYPQSETAHDLFARMYFDVLLGATKTEVKVGLDREQQIFGNLKGRMNVCRWPMLSWIQLELYNRLESRVDQVYASRLRDIKKDGENRVTGTSPLIWISDEGLRAVFSNSTRALKRPFSILLQSFGLWVKSLGQFLFAWMINRGVTRPDRIFRYTANANPEWKRTMGKFLQHLEKGEGFTFAHFNDGEMTFIKKYLAENHSETWFGRRQQKYNRQLGERLTNALKLDMERYYVGVPCSTHHPRLRKLADSLTQGNSGVVPAMSLHHNPRYIPNLINRMKERECFFIKNEFQKLDIFEKLGVEIKKENQVIVPFKNSYLLYDELKDRKFPEGAIVILICGMLAKIIIPVWFKNNPDTTFLALGSSMDDFIQRTNTKFTLYPKEGMPLTGNIQPTKFFAFGWKKECKECWTMEKHLN